RSNLISGTATTLQEPCLAARYDVESAAYLGQPLQDGKIAVGLHRKANGVVKSNGNLSILQRLAKLGSGFDIVSGGELRLLQRIGVPGDRIVFSGVGKSREEIREALNYSISGQDGRRGILLFNADSEAELER